MEGQYCGDGECKLADKCYNFETDHCYVCCFNDGATPRNFFDPNEEGQQIPENELDEYIVS